MPVDKQRVRAFKRAVRKYVAAHKKKIHKYGFMLPRGLRRTKISIGKSLRVGDKISICRGNKYKLRCIVGIQPDPIGDDLSIAVRIKNEEIWFSLIHCCEF